MRILVLIAIGLLLYVIIGNFLRRNRSSSPKTRAENMVQCHYCGLHILEEEAIRGSNEYYCSKEHLDADK